MADQGDQEQQVQLDSMDQAAMEQAQSTEALGEALNGMPLGGLSGGLGDGMTARAQAQMAEIQQRADMKTRLAEASSSGSTMRVDPDQVDKLATYFEDKGEELRGRLMNLELLANVDPPGTDPASTQAATVYSQVGQGDEQAYVNNYKKLITVFEDTASNLRSSAQQTRSDEQGAEESMGKGLSA